MAPLWCMGRLVQHPRAEAGVRADLQVSICPIKQARTSEVSTKMAMVVRLYLLLSVKAGLAVAMIWKPPSLFVVRPGEEIVPSLPGRFAGEPAGRGI